MRLKKSHLVGEVNIPASKSLLHRAIICASLARGRSIIKNVSYSDDIDATINAMKALGTVIFKHDDCIEIDGTTTFFKNQCEIDCKESASTLRFLIPLSIVGEANIHFIGEGNLGKRPLDIYYRIFEKQNIAYLYRENVLDLFIRGHLSAGVFEIPGNVSSQFISGLLFALPLMDRDSRIIITSPLESKDYVDLTIQMLRYYGVYVINNDYKEFIVLGNQMYKAKDYVCESDYSQAAYYLVANALGSDICVKGLSLQSKQGDRRVIDILENMGCHFSFDDGYKADHLALKGIDIDGSQIPDIVPILALACCMSEGKSVISHLSRLRYKECDRLNATYEMLKALGAHIAIVEDSLVIEGVKSLKGGSVSTYHDHRMAMLSAICATVCEGDVVIDDCQCVNKSYPHFFDDYKRLGGCFDGCDLGE